jgi:hypothetical protein
MRSPPLQVRWDNSTWPVEETSEDVLSWLTDVFANETWVPRKIRAAQLVSERGSE